MSQFFKHFNPNDPKEKRKMSRILDGLGQPTGIPTNAQPGGLPIQTLIPQFFLQAVPLMLQRDNTVSPEECVNRAWLVTRRTFNKLGINFPEDQPDTADHEEGPQP